MAAARTSEKSFGSLKMPRRLEPQDQVGLAGFGVEAVAVDDRRPARPTVDHVVVLEQGTGSRRPGTKQTIAVKNALSRAGVFYQHQKEQESRSPPC